jgi:hypothetical protein
MRIAALFIVVIGLLLGPALAQEYIECAGCKFLVPKEPGQMWLGKYYCKPCYDQKLAESHAAAEAKHAASRTACATCGKELYLDRDRYLYVGTGGVGAYYCSQACRDAGWSCSKCGVALAQTGGIRAIGPGGEEVLRYRSIEGRRLCEACYQREVASGAKPADAPAGAPAATPEPAPSSGGKGLYVIIGVTVVVAGALLVVAKRVGE